MCNTTPCLSSDLLSEGSLSAYETSILTFVFRVFLFLWIFFGLFKLKTHFYMLMTTSRTFDLFLQAISLVVVCGLWPEAELDLTVLCASVLVIVCMTWGKSPRGSSLSGFLLAHQTCQAHCSRRVFAGVLSSARDPLHSDLLRIVSVQTYSDRSFLTTISKVPTPLVTVTLSCFNFFLASVPFTSSSPASSTRTKTSREQSRNFLSYHCISRA